MSLLEKFSSAWKNRENLGYSNKTRELAAFLPAALEIQESPQNPIAKWLGRSLIALFTLVIIWACVGEVNIVASAEGKIIPSSRIKIIQAPEKAIVKKILVSEGQYVKAGQALIELDSTLTDADENRLSSELRRASLTLQVDLQLVKLLESQNDRENIVNPLTFENIKWDSLARNSHSDRQLHKQLLWQHWQQYNTQKTTLLSTLEKSKAEKSATKEVIKKLKQTLPIIILREKNMQLLVEENAASETEYLKLKQERIEKTQDLAAENQRLNQLKAAVDEVQSRIDNLIAKTHVEKLTAIAESKNKIASLEEELIKAVDINSKQVLYSPVSGEVKQLTTNTIGGVVTVAQELMFIVPDTEQLEVEVFLENNDIGFVYEGMSSEIKIHTFPFTKYGIIEGEITHVSDDATLDENKGLIYGMHLLMKKKTLLVKGKEVKLIPGMAVTAEIQIGHRKIIEFFLAPLLRYKKEGLRER